MLRFGDHSRNGLVAFGDGIVQLQTKTIYHYVIHTSRCGVVQWVARLTRNVKVMGSSPIKGHRYFLEQESSPFMLSTGWF